MKQSKFIDKLAEFRIRLGRGQGLTYEIKAAMTLAMAIKILFEISLSSTIFLTLTAFVVFFFIGWFDLKYLHLLQTEQALNTSKYNPHLNKIK